MSDKMAILMAEYNKMMTTMDWIEIVFYENDLNYY